MCNTDLNNPQGFLLFEAEDGTPDYISAEDFTELVSTVRPALVVLTACRSALAHRSESVFNGIAQSLLQEVPAVVGTAFKISEDSIIGFIKQFYRTLGAEKSLLEAVNRASQSMIYKNYEWYRLMTFLNHSAEENGYLFDFEDRENITEFQEANSSTQQVSTTPVDFRRKSNVNNGELVSFDLNFFNTSNLNQFIVKLYIAFGYLDQEFEFKDSYLIFFKRDKRDCIRLRIKRGKLHLNLENGSMPLPERIRRTNQINNQNSQRDWKVSATGNENNPIWTFETETQQSINETQQAINGELIGIIDLSGNPCVVKGIFKCNISGNDLEIIDSNGVWDNHTSNSKKVTKIRALLKDNLSQVVWTYDSTRIS